MLQHDEIQISCLCPFCGHTSFLAVKEKDYVAWRNGELIQNAFPYLSASIREVIKTGICSKCWEETFNDG